jgi:two-component system chemotaxis response regulator CheB
VSTQKRIAVLVVDDSALIRSLISEIINAEPDMHVVGVAIDPFAAREQIKKLNPDVVTLDVEMPRMNGLEFLERLMRLRPTPVVMFSSLTAAGAATTLRALELGAVDFVCKPSIDIEGGVLELAADLTDKIRAAACARVRRYVERAVEQDVAPSLSADAVLPLTAPAHVRSDETIIVIGASTGGTEALKEVLERIPRNAPPILVTQHMPPGFTKSFADRLDRICQIDVCEATSGMRLLSGHAYIAPGSAHLLVARRGSLGYTQLSDGPPVNRHRPAVDVLFRSAASTYGKRAIGVILTGMGKDGAAGMGELHDLDAFTVAQDEASCVVYGMPKAAIDAGVVSRVAPLGAIAGIVMQRVGIAH